VSVEESEVPAGEAAEDTEGAAPEAIETTAALVAKHYPIAPGYRVNVRSGPGTNYGVIRMLPVGASVSINCQVNGTTESGPYGTTKIWDNVANGQYVSDAFVHTGSDGFITVRCG
jgi:uncharacterized protein YraI